MFFVFFLASYYHTRSFTWTLLMYHFELFYEMIHIFFQSFSQKYPQVTVTADPLTQCVTSRAMMSVDVWGSCAPLQLLFSLFPAFALRPLSGIWICLCTSLLFATWHVWDDLETILAVELLLFFYVHLKLVCLQHWLYWPPILPVNCCFIISNINVTDTALILSLQEISLTQQFYIFCLNLLFSLPHVVLVTWARWSSTAISLSAASSTGLSCRLSSTWLISRKNKRAYSGEKHPYDLYCTELEISWNQEISDRKKKNFRAKWNSVSR